MNPLAVVLILAVVVAPISLAMLIALPFCNPVVMHGQFMLGMMEGLTKIHNRHGDGGTQV